MGFLDQATGHLGISRFPVEQAANHDTITTFSMVGRLPEYAGIKASLVIIAFT